MWCEHPRILGPVVGQFYEAGQRLLVFLSLAETQRGPDRWKAKSSSGWFLFGSQLGAGLLGKVPWQVKVRPPDGRFLGSSARLRIFNQPPGYWDSLEALATAVPKSSWTAPGQVVVSLEKAFAMLWQPWATEETCIHWSCYCDNKIVPENHWDSTKTSKPDRPCIL